MDNEKKPKKKRIDDLFDNMPYEEPDTEPRKDLEEPIGQDEKVTEETLSQETESTPVEDEAEDPGLDQEEGESGQSEMSEPESDKEGGSSPTETAESEEDLSTEDLLEDVRHSLIAETVEKEEVKESKWWRRVGKSLRRKKKEVETEQQSETVEIPTEPEIVETVEVEKEDEYVEQLDELIDILEEGEKTGEDSSVALSTVPVEEEPTPEPEIVDISVLRERAFHSRPLSEEEDRSLSEVRSIALDDGEEVFIEVEAKKEDTRQDRLKAIENALRPYARYFTFIFIFVSVVMVLLVSVSMYRLYQRNLPPPPTEEPVLLPYPVGMNLPGGLKFTLGKGKIQDGRWDPRSPEWLEDTEICRWVAIPYSRQLEAVVRTLTREDQIELIMSNNDVIAYTVNSIDQLTLEELQQRDSNTPCLLLILAQSDTDERWVVTAMP